MAPAKKNDLAEMAKTLTAMCVRNTEIEDIHAGRYPVTRTGDYSDVRVIDADGNEFSWADASHISDEEMKMLMKGVVNRLYAFLMQCDDPAFDRFIYYHAQFTRGWDDPVVHPSLDCEKAASLFI
ncbi:hypothetical protein AWH62_03220 [Maricaulis sp. W15]|uniref:hypothetical protein n=1 Tax=Maricaulis sp. W15 TaxID=1772333 RepID=UPI0009663A33|nr:hypothetical protein [Maricaulis sp. W15]OLF77699.1 hypothetical protein AWH62_03220 [Maricaulis sp. W15]